MKSLFLLSNKFVRRGSRLCFSMQAENLMIVSGRFMLSEGMDVKPLAHWMHTILLLFMLAQGGGGTGLLHIGSELLVWRAVMTDFSRNPDAHLQGSSGFSFVLYGSS